MTQTISYSILYLFVSVVWLLVFRGKSSEPSFRNLSIAFLLGLSFGPVAGILSLFLSFPFESLPFHFSPGSVSFLTFFIVVGPVEETVKLIAAFTAISRIQKIPSPLSGLLLAIAASLGFAGGENVLYLLGAGIDVTLPRLFLGNLGHAAFSLFWGYALGVVFYHKREQLLIFKGLFLSGILHGAYDYLLTDPELIVFSILMLILLIPLLFYMVYLEKRSV